MAFEAVKAGTPLPDLEVYGVNPGVDIGWLVAKGRAALPLCRAVARSVESPICKLREIEVTLVSDDEIAAVHGEFLDDPTVTDVITFHHGEILISVETAERQSVDSGLELGQEVLLYLIHGLLHLADWDDHDPEGAKVMADLQESIRLQVSG